MTRRSILFLALLSLVAIACPGQNPPRSTQNAKTAAPDAPVAWKLSKSGLGFRLSNADDDAESPRDPKATPFIPLGTEDARKLTSRLPELRRDPDDDKAFAMRAKSIPAPRPGKTVNEAFPPPAGPPPTSTPAAGPLTIERHAPEGNVDLAPYLTMTFTQPMVAVDAGEKEHPPVKLVPEPPGKWRWIGTRTLMFQPDKRFPMATDYAVTVPAGTRAMNGQTLSRVETWAFATPPPTMKRTFPHGDSEPRDPILFVEFDQAIDANAMLGSIELSDGRHVAPIQLAEANAIEANDGVRLLSQQAEKGRWIAVRPVHPLPTATHFTVTIKAGAKGAEGPKATTKAQSFSFSTYGPMRISSHSCSTGSHGKESCPPLAPLSLSFTTAIDLNTFDRSMVTATPEIPGMKVEVYGQEMILRGRTKGRTKYAVTIAGTIGDTHGQTMGNAASVTFDLGSAEPTMFGAEQEMIVLDPIQKAKDYTVYTINEPGLRARVFAVTPDDWKKYVAYRREWERPRTISPPGRLVYDKVVTPKKAPDELVATAVDLAPAFTSGLGQALVVVEPTRAMPKDAHRPELAVWIQSTEIGLDAMIESQQVTGWATRLRDGSPMEGVDVQLLGAASAKTDVQGLARVPLSQTPGTLVVGRNGNDVVIVPERWFGEPSYTHTEQADQVRWLVYDDRGMYKPGEEMRIKGWVRRAGMGRGGDLDAIPEIAGKTVSYRVRDPRWAEIGSGTATLDEHGSFDLAFKIPTSANLGTAQIEMDLAVGLSNSKASHAFQLQEFRRPEFEVTAKSTEGPHVVGDHAVTTLTAAYYSGGGLPDAPVTWNVTRSTTSFTPPNRSDYHFGPEPAFFWSRRGSNDEVKTETWTAKTNPHGVHRLRIDFDAITPSYPMKLDITGTALDVNRQQWAGRTSMVVHPSSVYSGIKLAKNFIRSGENIEADVVLVDIDGKATGGKHAVVKAARIDWEQKGTEHQEKELETQTCEVDSPAAPSSGSEKLHCSFKTREGGTWRVSSIVTDEHGRKNQTTTSLWVMGSDRPKNRGLERANVNVVLDKKEVQPGEVAEVLVVAPFAPAEAILTIRRQGIVRSERFRMKTTSHTLKVKLDETLVPNAEIRVDVVGQDVREDSVGIVDERLPKRPAFASGSTEVRVLPTARTLDVRANAKRASLEPGGSTQIEVDVKDAAGRGVSDAEVSLIVADESVLALSDYTTPDPIAIFYANRTSDVRELGMRDHVLLGEPDLTKLLDRSGPGGLRHGGVTIDESMARVALPAAMAPRAPPTPAPEPMAAGKLENLKKADVASPAASAATPPISNTKTPMQVRADFSALALFAPNVKTDRSGHATVPIKLPDNLTRYRVMAVAATRDRSFGANESTLTAKLPLMVRPSAPRFLNFGDEFELPVVIQNQTDQPIDVGIVARATHASIEEPSAKRVKIAGNDRAEVRFHASANGPGTARFQFGVASGGFSDASQIEVPVWTPATTEAFATYGEIDDGAMAQPVKMPTGVFPQFGGLEVTTSSTQLQALTDAVVYLYKYPFECNEQLASRVITIAALRDVLAAFESKDLPPPATLVESMKSDFEKLKRRQHYSGGWGFWQEEPWPYLTIHVAHALARAKDKGYTPDPQMFQRALGYLRSIESHIPSWYGAEARRAIIAYSVYVRDRMKDPDAAKARRVIAEAGGVDKVGIEAIGWLWPTISQDKSSAAENEAIRRHVANRVTETAGAAHFVSGYKDADWVLLHSDRRADGVLLEAMIGDQKDSTLIPKLVKGLLGHRKAGRWENTQENAFVLLALDRYFNTYEKVTPDFVARVWLGDKFAGEHAFKGRTTEYSHIGIPMQFLANEPQKEQNLLIGKDGPGRLYYRVGMQYAPTDLKLPPADHGFVVSRLYEGVDKPDDVKRDSNGTWHVKAGAKVRVRVSMVAPSRRYHVALVDSMAAGLEPMNPALAVTGEIPKDPKAADPMGGRHGYGSRTWYEHQNMRDERVEAFASLLWDGVWEYAYVARATTPGTFVVPPAKAEEMYSPETFGRSSGDRMMIE